MKIWTYLKCMKNNHDTKHSDCNLNRVYIAIEAPKKSAINSDKMRYKLHV